MLKWLSDFAGFLLSSVIFGWIIRRLPRSLVDNAMTSYIDNKIGGFFGLTEAAADGFLSEWIVPILLGIAAVLIWHRFATAQYSSSLIPEHSSGDRFSATGIVGDGLPQRWLQIVEPYHVIILGLLIAVGGVAWMLYRSSEAAKISQTDRAAILIAPFQAQIDSLNRQLALLRSKTPPSQREFTTRTIRELRAFYEGRTGLQADAFMADEKGKLIEVEGVVVNISSGMAFLQVGQEAHNGMPDQVECRFGPQWNAKLGTFRPRETMKIRGTIGPTQNGAQIYLQDCEIIS